MVGLTMCKKVKGIQQIEWISLHLFWYMKYVNG